MFFKSVSPAPAPATETKKGLFDRVSEADRNASALRHQRKLELERARASRTLRVEVGDQAPAPAPETGSGSGLVALAIGAAAILLPFLAARGAAKKAAEAERLRQELEALRAQQAAAAGTP
jgi:hypothetical protein